MDAFQSFEEFPLPQVSAVYVVVGQPKHAKKGGSGAASEIDTNTTAAAEATEAGGRVSKPRAHLTIVHKPAPNCFFALLGPQQPAAAAAEVRLVRRGMFF